MNLKFFVVLAAFVFPAAGADLSLVIRDASGAPIAQAQAVVTHIETGIERRSQTNTDGLYRFAALPVGNYKVRVEKGGFSPRHRSQHGVGHGLGGALHVRPIHLGRGPAPSPARREDFLLRLEIKTQRNHHLVAVLTQVAEFPFLSRRHRRGTQ